MAPRVRNPVRDLDAEPGRTLAVAGEHGGELAKLREKYRLVLEVSRTITSSLKLDRIFHEIVRGVGGLFPSDRSTLILYNETTQSFRIFALEAAARRYRGSDLVIPKERSNMGWVFANGRYYINPDVTAHCRSIEDEYLMKRGIKSYIVLPLLYRERVIGTYNVGSKRVAAYSPMDAELLMHIASQIATAVENARAYEAIEEMCDSLSGENEYLKEEIKSVYNFDEIIGTSEELRKVLSDVSKVAPAECTVLIRGETGTGKELIARAIHNRSKRREKPFVRINCAAVPDGLIESELFGYERGAFTGATSRKTGLFEVAHGGTILLDEIGDISAGMQSKILRVLEEREFVRLGDTRTTKVDVRIIAATNRDLESAIGEGHFRADLFYRLSAFPISLPPLRERRNDIPMLVKYFAAKHAKLMSKQIMKIDPAAMRTFVTYDWPGNVRELENVIERAVILCEGETLRFYDHLLGPLGAPTIKPENRIAERLPTLNELERTHILEVLKRTGGRIYGRGGAAEMTGLKPTTLQSRIKKLGIRKVALIH